MLKSFLADVYKQINFLEMEYYFIFYSYSNEKSKSDFVPAIIIVELG